MSICQKKKKNKIKQSNNDTSFMMELTLILIHIKKETNTQVLPVHL